MKVAIGSDHGGFELKERLKEFLAGEGHAVLDAGAHSEASCDYPDYALEVAEAVVSGKARRGILICRTGIGMSIAANKVPGIRAALCTDEETARLSRTHNDANVLALAGNTNHQDAVNIVKTWLETDFTGGRHAVRLEKINAIEKKYSRPPRVG